jgi:hypothetical protein
MATFILRTLFQGDWYSKRMGDKADRVMLLCNIPMAPSRALQL